MEAQQTRQRLITEIHRVRADLERVIDEVGAGRMEQPGAMGGWAFKDVVAHLAGWHSWGIARLEAARTGAEPGDAWPTSLGDDVDAINDWFYQQSKGKSAQQVLAELRQSFDQIEAGIEALSDEDLLTPGRFPWAKGKALGPWVVEGTTGHYYEEHEGDLRAWLKGLSD